MPYLTFLIFGGIGGLARGLLGAYKHSLKPGNNKKISWPKLILNIVACAVVGMVVGLIVDGDPVTAAAAGYVGIDVIESLIKLSKR